MKNMTEMFMSLMEAKARREAPRDSKEGKSKSYFQVPTNPCWQNLGSLMGEKQPSILRSTWWKQLFTKFVATIHKICEKGLLSRSFANLVESELKGVIITFCR